jgi:prephenate dehydrogenase
MGEQQRQADTPALFQKMAIAGVGLIGGSLALAARRAGLVGEVVGFGRRESNLRLARDRGIIDRYSLEAQEAARDADLLFLALPVRAMAQVAATCAPVLRPGAIVTDAGSVKRSVTRAVEAALPAGIPFVPAHPIAGGEQAGAIAAAENLFKGSLCVVTPGSTSTPEAIAKIRRLWEGVGMRVIEMDAEKHDAILARVSHLPHVVAFAFVDALRRHEDEVAQLAGASFRDLTRIAASPTEVWADIFATNRVPLLAALDELVAALGEFRAAIEREDDTAMRALIERARSAHAKMRG